MPTANLNDDSGGTVPALLYHYTCAHAAPAIDIDNELRPQWQPVLARRLVWLTDLAEPVPELLGLTNYVLRCDRTRHRYTIPRDTPGVIWWPHYARGVTVSMRRELEQYGMPSHWWVSERPVPVLQGARWTS